MLGVGREKKKKKIMKATEGAIRFGLKEKIR